MTTGGGPPLVARAEELRLVQGVAAFSEGARTVVVEGEAGIGKTALLRAALAAAADAGASVLTAAAAESEARFAYAPIGDLLRDLPPEILAALPQVQRSAVERALLLGDAAQGGVELHAVSAGFAGVLSALAEAAPLLVAVDDLQWLDSASVTVLAYALRRAPADRIRFVLTQRPGPAPLGLRTAIAGAEVVRLEPLTVGALQRLLLTHGFAFAGLAVRRIHERSGGNPFFALEMARALARRGGELGRLGEVPVPETLLGLLDERVAGLSAEGEQAVLAAAVAADPRLAMLHDVLGGEAGLDAAEAAGLLVPEDGRVRLTHPLVGTAVRARAPAPALRRLHAELARRAASAEERIRHLALATVPPDEPTAAALEEASASAAARGATAAAAELSREAVRFTPGDDPATRHRRLNFAGDLHMRAGLLVEGRALLEPELDGFPAGPERVQAQYHLLRLARRDLDLDAWEEVAAGAEGGLRSDILAETAFSAAAGAVTRLDDARRWADEAVALARADGDPARLIAAEQSAGFVAALQGDHEPARAVAAADLPPSLPLTNSAGRLVALTAIWRGDVAAAGAVLDELFEEALRRGEEWAAATMILHRYELRARIGDRFLVEETIDEFERTTAALGPLVDQTLPRMRAYAAALRGDVGGAQVRLEPDASSWQRLEAARAVGFARLLTGDAAGAAVELLAVHERLQAAAVCEPGAFPAGGDAAEALVVLGRLDEAGRLQRELAAAAERGDHPWALVVGARVAGLIAAAEGDAAGAEAAYRRALAAHEHLHLHLDEARTRLALGTLLRRERRLREAREQLEAAAERFDALGVAPLSARARDELDRVPGRRSTAGLTASEEQVARLVAQGLTNKEVAAALVITPKVVERHLTRVYAKLGVRTRTELALRVAESGGIPLLVADP